MWRFIRVLAEACTLKVAATHRWAPAFVLLMVPFLVTATGAQAGQALQSSTSAASDGSQVVFPKPTNLRVLPKEMTGREVRDLMKQWSGALGARCDACHTADSQSPEADGRPRLNFADDSKPMKTISRLMYSMTEEINANYISKVDGSGMPVTCGSCHRGAVTPEPFEIPAADGKAPIESGH